MKTSTQIVFFGTPDFSVTILEELKKSDYTPSLVITAPDKKIGRKHILTRPPVAQWAYENSIPFLQPQHPKEVQSKLSALVNTVFIVAAYGYIIPQSILDIPTHGTLNVHTSILPKYRGACPIESAILNGDSATGSTIMLMDSKMDHGPILAQESIPLDEHTNREELFTILSQHGAELLCSTLPFWLSGDLKPQQQDHGNATFCQKITKADGDITSDDDQARYRKYLAYYGWPGVFFFEDDNNRIKVTRARYEDSKFIIERVIPEGKKEVDYAQYLAHKKHTS